MTFLYWLVRFLVLCFAKVFLRLEVHGLENIPTEKGVIIAPNHVSNFDPPIVGVSVPFACHYFAKEELFANRYFGWLIRHLNAMPVKRGAIDRTAIHDAMDVLKNKGALLFFPEGTRSQDGELHDAKMGISMLARQAGVGVVPVYIAGTDKVLPKGASRIHFHKVVVHFGRPVELPNDPALVANKKEYYKNFADDVMDAIAALKRKSAE